MSIGDLFFAGGAGRIWKSTNNGSTWTELTPYGSQDIYWSSFASSGDGTILVAGSYSDKVFVSRDGGTSWTDLSTLGVPQSGAWTAGAVSADGSTIIIGSSNGARIWLSIDGGLSFNETQPAGNVNKDWGVAYTNADGTILYAAVWGGRVYKSINKGVSWSEVQPDGNADRSWTLIGMSFDAQTVILGQYSGRLFVSIDGGTTWFEAQPAGNQNRNWLYTGDMDNDGNKIIAAAFGGRVYLSTNKGATWTETQPNGNSDFSWLHTSISGDGSVLIVGNDSYLGMSTDGGTTWNSINPLGSGGVWRSGDIARGLPVLLPVIDTQPTDQQVEFGSALNLSISAHGTGTLHYQWKQGVTNVGIDSNTYTKSNFADADRGTYTCTVTDNNGSIDSDTVTVAAKPKITTQPVDQQLVFSSTLALTVVATGHLLTYQWKHGIVNVGTNSSSYIKSNFADTDRGIYTVDVTSDGITITSNSINVISLPQIIVQPLTQEVQRNTPVTLSVVVTGHSPTYQWKKNGTIISGETNSTYAISSFTDNNVGSYTVDVSCDSNSTTSNAALLSIKKRTTLKTPIYKGKVLTKDDLNVFLLDSSGNYFDPFSISYTIYRVISDRFYNQECGEEPIVETIDSLPIPFGIGKYFAAWKSANDLDIGKYRIHWFVRRFADSPVYQEIEEFDVINKIDQYNYSMMNGVKGTLPHEQFGNENLCAG